MHQFTVIPACTKKECCSYLGWSVIPHSRKVVRLLLLFKPLQIHPPHLRLAPTHGVHTPPEILFVLLLRHAFPRVRNPTRTPPAHEITPHRSREIGVAPCETQIEGETDAGPLFLEDLHLPGDEPLGSGESRWLAVFTQMRTRRDIIWLEHLRSVRQYTGRGGRAGGGHSEWHSRPEGGSGAEDEPDAVLDVKEEVVDQGLDVVLSGRFGERTETDGEQPDMDVGDGEPGLEGWWKGAF
jgi:hypothetical protein